jgi:single-strand DNA-binding protein
MASGLNKVLLIGRLGKDPEVRYTTTGGSVATFSIATNENWTDKNGQKQERTEWHRIVAWGKLGEICGQYLSKGREAFVEGRLQTREWTDKEGHKRYTTEIVASNVQFLGGASDKASTASDFAAPSFETPSMETQAGGGMVDDEVPF